MALENGVVTEGGNASFAETPVADASPADEGNPSDVNWNEYATEMDEVDAAPYVEGDVEIVEPASEPSPQTPAPTTMPTPDAGVTPPIVPSPEVPATPAAPPTPPSVAPETPPAPTVDYEAWRGEQIGKLEERYGLSDDLAAQLLTEPEKVLPKMAAHLHMAVTEAVLHSINNSLPQVLESINSSRTNEQTAVKMFNDANPDLVDPKYRESILKIGTMYRQVNPKATPDESVRVIGNMVRTALGMQAPAAQAPAAAASTPPAQTPAPYVPTRGGGGGVVPSASQNVWSQMASELTEDD